MLIKICPICNKEFQQHGRQKYCSNTCFKKFENEYDKLYRKKYRIINREKINIYQRINYCFNKKQITKYNKKYCNQRYYNDNNYKLLCNIRSRLFGALKNNSKYTSTIQLLGCSISELKTHLENQFKPGMTWENHGQWHIDHIIPCCYFDLSLDEEQKKCFHYTNLQPLWAEENLSKGGKYAE